MRLFLSCLLAATVCLFGSRICRADDGGSDPPPSYRPQADMRTGGVLEESHTYHRQTGMSAPRAGWYGYGFPVQTFRWGWFGAEHYYPTVWWHHGYYGDCCRHAYRRGY